MDQQVQQQIEQTLRNQWTQICPQILERFTTVSKADLDAARDVNDLVRRVADRTHYSERYVENQVTELVLSGGGQSFQPSIGSGQTSGMPQQGQSQQQQGQQGQQSQQPYGSR